MQKIKNLLKTNKFVYFLYSTIMNSILKIVSIFVRTDDSIILFNSFGGKRFDDSPRVIFEYMVSEQRYNKLKFYWVLDNPESVTIENATVIKNNSVKFFLIALKAKYWVTNSGMERGLKFKKKNTVFINTWHGSAIKHIGKDENNLKINFKASDPDFVFAQSEYDVEIFSHIFDVEKDKVVLAGLPRNDELKYVSQEEIIEIKKKLNLPLDKKIILYAPTYREYNRDANGCVLAPPIDLKMWEEKLGSQYVLLFRAHYEVNKVLGIEESEFVKNYSDYKNLNELLKISDILISDYSSIMIDYSILERPIVNYTYDYEEYKEKRGMYFDLREKLSGNCIDSEVELLEKIIGMDYEAEKMKTKSFKEEFVQVYGNARKYIDKIVSI